MFKLKKSELPLHLMLLPAFLIVLVYSYGPMTGVVMAFEKFFPNKGIFHSKWIGLDHFKYMLLLPDTKQVVINTVVIAFFKIAAGLIVPFIVALLLNEVRAVLFKRSVQTLIYMPHFLSWVILGGILIDILSPSNGLVNQTLQLFGVKPISFLGDNHWFRFVLILSDVWKEFGFNTIVFLAALTGINPSLYEAAEVDGAGHWKRALHITIPGILPIVILLATLSLGNILNAGFDQVFNLYNPLVYSTGDIIDTYVYRLGIQQSQYALATAIGLFKSVIAFIFIMSSYSLAYRFANYRIF